MKCRISKDVYDEYYADLSIRFGDGLSPDAYDTEYYSDPDDIEEEHHERLKKDEVTSRFKNVYGESEDWKRFQHFVNACDIEQMHDF